MSLCRSRASHPRIAEFRQIESITEDGCGIRGVLCDRDFVGSEADFILDPRRFNASLTRARSKFVMLVCDAVVPHLLPADAEVARDADQLQVFVENYCSALDERISLAFRDRRREVRMPCRLRGHG